MSEDRTKDEKISKPPDYMLHGAMFRAIILVIAFVVIGFILFGHKSCASDRDERWDTIEHNIKTEPYYKQW